MPKFVGGQAKLGLKTSAKVRGMLETPAKRDLRDRSARHRRIRKIPPTAQQALAYQILQCSLPFRLEKRMQVPQGNLVRRGNALKG